jgi:hypothetical protein
MNYDYRCDVCGGVTAAQRAVADRDDSPVCCGRPGRRLIASPRINTGRWCYDDFPTGTSVKDRVAEARKADATYEKSWGDHVPTAQTVKQPSLMEVARGMGW